MAPARQSVVRVSGGLGNQLLQYAFALWLSEQVGMSALIDDTFYCRRIRVRGTPRTGFLRVVFPEYVPFIAGLAGLERLPIGEVARMAVAMKLRWEGRRIVSDAGTSVEDVKRMLKRGEKIYFDGLWFNHQYCAAFTARIRAALGKALQALAPGAASHQARGARVAIHVRGTDLLNNGHVICGSRYYNDAVRLIQGRFGLTDYVVFTDDTDFARKVLPAGARYTYASDANRHAPMADLLAMSGYPIQVIANSTFSWWSAILNAEPDKWVLAPRSWGQPGALLPIADIALERWQIIDN